MPLECTATMPDGTTYSSPTFQGDSGAYSNIEASSGNAAVESTTEAAPVDVVVVEEEDAEVMPSKLSVWLSSFCLLYTSPSPRD